MRNYLLFLLLPFLPAMPACKKPKSIIPDQPAIVNTGLANGLPSDIKNINGYLYAETNYSGYSYFYSVFSDPGKGLINSYNHRNNNIQFESGNIDVGGVQLNSFVLSHQNTGTSVLYTGSSYTNVQSANWISDGNGTFKPLNVTLARGFPSLDPNIFPSNSISKSSGVVVDISSFINNYDSVIVSITDSYTQAGSTKMSTSAGQFTFTSSDLSAISNSYGYVNVYAYNYTHQTINSKVYLFELGSKFNKSVSITP